MSYEPLTYDRLSSESRLTCEQMIYFGGTDFGGVHHDTFPQPAGVEIKTGEEFEKYLESIRNDPKKLEEFIALIAKINDEMLPEATMQMRNFFVDQEVFMNTPIGVNEDLDETPKGAVKGIIEKGPKDLSKRSDFGPGSPQ